MNIGLSVEITKKISHELQVLLANEYVLFTKCYKYHWNVSGKHFGPLHALFKEGYELLFEVVDEVAERMVQLGHPAHATLTEFLQHSDIKEDAGVIPSSETMIKSLLDGFEVVIRQLRTIINLSDSDYRDMGTNNMVSDLIQKHEKYAWFLRAHLQ